MTASIAFRCVRCGHRGVATLSAPPPPWWNWWAKLAPPPRGPFVLKCLDCGQENKVRRPV